MGFLLAEQISQGFRLLPPSQGELNVVIFLNFLTILFVQKRVARSLTAAPSSPNLSYVGSPEFGSWLIIGETKSDCSRAPAFPSIGPKYK